MRRSSFFSTSKDVFKYSGNEPIYNKKAIIYGHDTYTWNGRFIALMDSFLLGDPIHNLADMTNDLLEKYVLFANGTLSTSDVDYELINQYNLFLATINTQVSN